MHALQNLGNMAVALSMPSGEFGVRLFELAKREPPFSVIRCSLWPVPMAKLNSDYIFDRGGLHS